MKNYVVIVTLNTANEIFATFHKVEDLDPMAKAMLEVNVNNAQELQLPAMEARTYDLATLQQNTIYVFQFDAFETPVEYNCGTSAETGEEHVMRTLGFRKCDRCGAWVTPQDRRTGASTYDRVQRLCPSCVASEEQELARNPRITLSGYHTTGHSVRVINGEGETFELDNVKGLGIEMEANASSRSTVVRNNQIKCTDTFYRMSRPGSHNRIFRCEQDCTVAAEIISNVFTKKALYAFDWNILADQLRLMGNDESIANVGFHVHLSKLWLGDTPKEQALNFLKLQYILKAYETDWLKISGRNPNEMGWCSFYSMHQIEDFKRNLESGRYNGCEWHIYPSSHSCALISSGNTIELRIGKSTNDPEKIKHYLRLVLGIVENLKSVRFEKIYCMSKIFKLVPSETMNYWRKNGAFLNTVAAESRGITVAQAA